MCPRHLNPARDGQLADFQRFHEKSVKIIFIALSFVTWAEVPASERANLFVRKLRLCAVICDFSEGAGNDRDKEIKRQERFHNFLILLVYVEKSVWFQTLLELVDYVNSAKQPFAEHIMPEVVNMVEYPNDIELFRCILPSIS